MLPASLPRFVQLPGDEVRFVSLESVVRCFTKQIFPDYQLVGDGAFRIIRDSDIEVEEEAEDLVRYFRNALQRRRRGRVIRLKLERGMPSDLTALLLDSLPEGDAIITDVDGLIGIRDVQHLVDCDRPHQQKIG